METENTDSVQETTKFCKHCGQKIHAAAVVCPHCGCQVEEVKSQAATPQITINNTNANTNVNTNIVGGAGGRIRNKWVAFSLVKSAHTNSMKVKSAWEFCTCSPSVYLVLAGSSTQSLCCLSPIPTTFE